MSLPRFIVEFEMSAGDRKEMFVKAMEQQDLTSALAKIEDTLQFNWSRVFIVNLFERIGEENRYHVVLMTRINSQKQDVVRWHRRSPVNGEDPWEDFQWVPGEDRQGTLVSENCSLYTK